MMIWKYQKGIISISSIWYLQWWTVDRTLDICEFWVGQFIMNTPSINIFYSLMGVRIYWTLSMNMFVCKVDLLEIHEDATIQHAIKCCKFKKWHHKDTNEGEISGLTLQFCPISIRHGCVVKGIVSLSDVVEKWSFIENLPVVSEGSRVPEASQVISTLVFATKKAPTFLGVTTSIL